jgi:CRISPR system Cascade subunit CasD
MSNLTLYLDGPLQSWGYMADHKYRNCLPHPTRSGLTGILGAALGIGRHDPNEAEKTGRFNALRMTILGLGAGRQIRDYHTAQTSGSSGRVVGDCTVTHRDYLVDSRFLVLLDGNEELLVEIEAALQNPVWFGTLGRRSCVPASPILLGQFESEAEAIAELEKRLGRAVQITLRVEETDAPGAVLLRDLPLSFSARTHGQRMILVSPR